MARRRTSTIADNATVHEPFKQDNARQNAFQCLWPLLIGSRELFENEFEYLIKPSALVRRYQMYLSLFKKQDLKAEMVFREIAFALIGLVVFVQDESRHRTAEGMGRSKGHGPWAKVL